MAVLNIAGFNVRFDFGVRDGSAEDTELLLKNFGDIFLRFAAREDCAPDMEFTFRDGDKYIPLGEPVTEISGDQWFRAYASDKSTDMAFLAGGQVYTSVRLNGDWSRAEVAEYPVRLDTDDGVMSRRYVCRHPFEGFLLLNGAVKFHAAAVAYKGEGVLFTAFSGVGKTTHAKLWEEHLGARILNGDSPILTVRGGEPLVCGSPWCGSSQDSLNLSVPLRAIVVLERGEKNSICELSGMDAFWRAFPGLRRPKWSERHLDRSVDILEEILKTVKVYRLACLPDAAAAEMVRDAVYFS